MPSRDPEDVLDRDELCRALKLGPELFRIRSREGEIPEPSFWIGSSPRWLWGDVMWWIKRRGRVPPQKAQKSPKKPKKSKENPNAPEGP
jgi:hypothetical protein